MPITGTIPITGGQSIVPCGSWFLKGEDGNHYVVVGTQGVADPSIKLGCAETNTTIWTRNGTEWAADFNGVGADGAPTAGSSGMAQGPIPIPGTKYFYIPGKVGGGPPEWSIAVRYAIESPSSIVVDGVFAYATVITPAGILGTVWCFGANVVDDELFAVCWLYNGIFDGNGRPYLLRLPLAYGTNIVESTTSVWPGLRTSLEAEIGDGADYFNSGGQGYFNFCTLLKHPESDTSVMILTYRNEDSLPGNESDLLTAGSEYIVVDYDAQTVGALTSGQALLGQPWDDVGLGYAGTPTSNNHFNDYSGPTERDGEVLFGRNHVDAPTIKKFRRFTYDPLTALFTPVDTFEVTIEDGTASDRAVMGYRDEDAILAGSYFVSQWMLGEFSLPEPSEEDCGFEDQDDEIQTAISWPKCELVPADIDVQLVSPSSSPGRALLGRDQVVKWDAGHWRIELSGIKVFTLEDVYLWREIESALDGRNNPILVPFYEAPLSGVPIAATPDAGYAIGSVRIGIIQTAGAELVPGMHFSAGECGYIIKRVFGTALGVTSVVIAPPLRRAIGISTELEFNDPVVRCRLERDDGMNVNLEHLKFATPSVALVEDV